VGSWNKDAVETTWKGPVKKGNGLNWTKPFYRSPAYRKKMSDAQRAARAKETSKQRELHNAKAAVAYRINNAFRVFPTESKERRAWVQIGADADAARVRALADYKDFLTLWKNADPDIPILKEAKTEYAKLQQVR
jgi:hypothetical protein